MNTRWTSWLAVSLWTVAMMLVVCLLVVERANGGLVNWLFPQGYVAAVLAMMIMATIGALLAIHRPENAIGWIDLCAGISLGILGLSGSYSEYVTITNPGGAPDPPLLFWPGAWAWVPAYFVLPSIGILIFPTGRLPSQRWRWFAWLVGGLLALMVVAEMFSPGPLDTEGEYPQITNPIAVESLSGALEPIVEYSELLVIPILGGPLISIIVRLRGAGATERQQIKWFAYAATVPVVGLMIYFILFALPAIGNNTADRVGEYIVLLGVAILPLTIGIAILKHNLYDIDRLINRTLVYGSLTALLLLGFVASVLMLQLILEPFTRGNDLAVAGSTLLVFALSRPLRDRLQNFVDRRFYRQHYDTQQTLQAFGLQARDAVDLDQLKMDLTTTITSTMQPAHLSIWLQHDERESSG